MRESWSVIWDLDDDPTGNVEHIAQHGLTKDEVEDILLDSTIPEDVSQSSGRPCKIGRTFTGRQIIVVWEDVVDDPRTVYPVTAYEID
jgi:hypothetical protein